MDTFIEIDKKFPEEAKQSYFTAKSLLVEYKQYDLLKKYGDDPIYDYEGLRNNREYELSQLRKNPDQMNLDQINEDFTKKVKTLVETSEKIGMPDEAKEINARFNAHMNGNLLRKYH